MEGAFVAGQPGKRDIDAAVIFRLSAKRDRSAFASDTGKCAGAELPGEEEAAKAAGRAGRYTVLIKSGKFFARICGAIKFYGNGDCLRIAVLTEKTEKRSRRRKNIAP